MEISDLAQECIKNALKDVRRAEEAYGNIPAVSESWKSLARSLALTFTFDNVEHIWGEKPNSWGFTTPYISVFCVGSRVSREKLADQLHVVHGISSEELTDDMPDVYIWSLHS